MSQKTLFNVTHFIIVGVSSVPDLQLPVFLLALLIYLVTLSGNMIIFLLVSLDCHLHTPMYFFLANLSILDMSSSPITLYMILLGFISGSRLVPYGGCILQMYVWASLIGLELLILSAMSYDRYVAICKPLRYRMIMSSKVCGLLCLICWISAFLQSLPHTIVVIKFSCYESIYINHFFCDILPLKYITCSDTTLLDHLILTSVLFHLFFSFPLTFTPYIFIIDAILRIPSTVGRRKAFHTCSSHLTVVILLYVVLLCQYLKPGQKNNLDSSKLFSLFNTAAVPMLNPMIYSLKNRDVKMALQREVKILKNGR